MLLSTAFIFGFLGSLHCLGMCAPLLWAMPQAGSIRSKVLIQKSLYNAGRLVTYVFLGLLVGLLGEGVNLFNWQQDLSWVSGAVLLTGLFAYALLKRHKFKSGASLSLHLRKVIGRIMTKKANSAHFMFGIANGFLPCGLVYMALIASLSMGGVKGSLSYMVLFGLGTFPMMFLAAYFGQSIKKLSIINVNKWAPRLMAVVAILLILRGLNLGIPYVSPQLNASEGITVCETE